MLSTQTIGNKIAEARKQIHISQAELAQRMFISAQAVGKWERGESMPDITTFNRLAEILGVDLNYFSERFQTTNVDHRMTPAETSGEQSVEMPSAKPKKTHHWDMSRGNWAGADFSGLKGLHEKFSSSNMQGCRFIGSDLSGLHLSKNNIASCDFSGSDVSSSHIQGSNLLSNIFRDCSLKDAEFSGSHIEDCNFIGANFGGAEFSKSHLYGCDCTGADFTRAVF